MKLQRRARLGASARPGLAAATAGALVALTLTSPFAGSATALTGPSPGTYAGPGFDTCDAPASDVMTSWLASSPYRAVGIYIGGNNRACLDQTNLTSSWVSAQRSAGWHLLPIYMGTQPYCTNSNKKYRFTAANAATTGLVEANDAVAQAQARALVKGSTIFSDIEAYSTTGKDSISGAPCTQAVTTAVLTYQSAWTSRLHDLGFLSGFYGSLDSGIKDQVAAYNSTAYVRPDYLWFARHDGIPTISDNTLPSTYWLHRRVKQYTAGADETYGGTMLNVDRDQLDVTPVPATTFGDFTGNGWSDLLAVQTSSGSLYLYPGNGTSFGLRSRVGGGWGAMNAITRWGDFNHDGHEDLVAREKATGALWLYLGAGAGFSSRVRLGGGWNTMREITPVGDFNQDGYPDLLAVQTSTGYLYLYPGHGTSLSAGRKIGGGWNAMTELVGAGDFNRDGHVDLIARQSASGDLWLYPGTGIGFGTRIRVGTGWNSMRDLVGIGDFDRDGFNDLIALERATGKLFLYPGRGTSFGPRVQFGTGWTVMSPLL